MPTSKNYALHYQLMFTENKAVMLLIDPDDGTIVDASLGACQYYGYSLSDLTAMSIFDINTMSKAEIAAEMQRAKEERKNHFNFRHRLASGEVRDVEVYSNPIPMEGQRFLYSIIHDITEHKHSEESLHESEAKYHLAMEAVQDALWDWDVTTGSVYYSPGWSSIIGEEHIQNNYSTWEDRIHPADKPRILNSLRSHLTGETTIWKEEHRLRKADGAWLWVLGRGQVVERDHQGNPLRMVGTMTDITERKRADEELRQANIVVESSPVVLFRWKAAEGWPVDFVSSNVGHFGYSARELMSSETPYSSIVHPDDLERVSREVKENSDTGVGQFDQEYRIVSPTGEIFWVDDRTTVERDADGNINRYKGIILDITERKQAETEKTQLLHDMGERVKELQCMFGITEATRKHVRLEDILYDAIGIIPPGWHYPEHTKARILFDGKEFIESTFQPTEWKQTSDLIIGGKCRGSVEVYYTKEFPELDEGPFLKHERNLINGIAKALSEIIERKQAEAEKGRLQRELQQAKKMKAVGQLTGGIAHDFNNILGIILGFSGLAHDQCISAGQTKAAEYLNHVQKAGERAADLVSKMQAFSHSKGGEYKVLHLMHLIEDDVKMLRSALPDSINIKTEFENNLPGVLIDPTQLNQALMNLGTNAKDAMDGKGTLTIHLNLAREMGAECFICHQQLKGDWVEISVSDTGTGIEPETMEYIFNPFFTTKDAGKGSGLGLAVILGTIRRHKGHILVESEPGKGTTFRLLFPPIVEETAKA